MARNLTNPSENPSAGNVLLDFVFYVAGAEANVPAPLPESSVRVHGFHPLLKAFALRLNL